MLPSSVVSIRVSLIVLGLLFLMDPMPAVAGQLLWTPGGPTLVLSLGDGVVKKTLTLPSGARTLTLTLRAFLLEDPTLRLSWKNGDALWFRQVKKIPGAEITETVVLPPGPTIGLEITTLGGAPVASIKLQRN